MNERLEYLTDAVSGLREVEHSEQTMDQNALRKWLDDAKLSYLSYNPRTRRAKGFDPNGLRALNLLAGHIRKATPELARGTTHGEIAKATADIAIKGFTIGEMPTAASATDVEAKVRAWFDSTAKALTQFVPCSISPWPAAAFTIGPVTFFHASELASHIPDNDPLLIVLEPFKLLMQQRLADWVARVDVPKATADRSIERADLAIDLALAVVKMIIPTVVSAPMGRATGRMAPPFLGQISLYNGQLVGSIKNKQPGLHVGPVHLDPFMAQAKPFLDADGSNITFFLTGAGTFSKISQGWCDAAYWYQEGLAEPLDTIATAKLESAIEVLLRAENPSGSETRIILAIQLLTGRTSDQPVFAGTPVTVKQFAKKLVAARSRVLHGTLSTLAEELTSERKYLEALACGLLNVIAALLPAYEKEASAEGDSVDKLLAWAKSKGAT